MDPASTSSAFSIEPKVPGEVKVSGNALTFSPTERLERNKEYKVTVGANAASAGGLKMLRDVTFKFVTAGFLGVSGTQPANGAGEVSVDSAITVAFNRPVVPLVPADQQAALPQPLVITPTVEGKGEWINTSMYRLTPATVLAASTLYTVTVPAGLTDTTGGVLQQPYTFKFSTIAPSVLRWAPELNLQGWHQQADHCNLLDADGQTQHGGRVHPARSRRQAGGGDVQLERNARRRWASSRRRR